MEVVKYPGQSLRRGGKKIESFDDELRQIATDMLALLEGGELDRPETDYSDVIVDEGPGQVPGATDVISLPRATLFNAAHTRQHMADTHEALKTFITDVHTPAPATARAADMELVEL